MARLKDCINLQTFIEILTDKLPRCGGDDWSGSNRFGRFGGLLRPDVPVVWFGEISPFVGEIARRITWCDLLIVVGTSLWDDKSFYQELHTQTASGC